MKNKKFTKSLFTGTIAILFVALVSVLAYAYSTGITGRTHKGPEPGCTCHGPSPSAGVSVQITGPSVVAQGQTVVYKVKISGGPLAAGGTNIAVKQGTINPGVGSGLQKIGDELTHTSPKSPVSDTVSFEFQYTAPMVSMTDTLFANGNSVDLSGSNSGDSWNFASNKAVQVTPPSGISNNGTVLEYKLHQNYPNPFNPSTSIKFDIVKSGYVSLKVFDMSGKEVKTLVSGIRQSGNNEVNFNAEGLSSGVYYCRLQTADFSSIIKMTLLK